MPHALAGGSRGQSALEVAVDPVARRAILEPQRGGFASQLCIPDALGRRIFGQRRVSSPSLLDRQRQALSPVSKPVVTEMNRSLVGGDDGLLRSTTSARPDGGEDGEGGEDRHPDHADRHQQRCREEQWGSGAAQPSSTDGSVHGAILAVDPGGSQAVGYVSLESRGLGPLGATR